MLVYSFLAPHKTNTEALPPNARTLWVTFGLGVLVTVLEFPTAFPYLGAVGILTGADLTPDQWIPVLLVYNVIFILPPTSLLLAHIAFGQRLEARFSGWQTRLQKEARETMLWIVGIAGFFLLAGALEHLEVFGL